MTLGKKGIKRFLLYLTALVIALVMLLPVLINPLVNSEALRTRIAREIKARSGVGITPDNIQLTLLPLPGITFLDVEAALAPGIGLFVQKVNIDLDLTKLLDRQIAVDRIDFEAPRIDYIPAAPDQKPTDGTGPWSRLHLQIPKAQVEDLFAMFPDSQDNLVIEIHKGRTPFFTNMEAQLSIFKDNRALIFSCQIQGVEITPQDLFPNLETAPPFDKGEASDLSVNLRLDRTGRLSGRTRISGLNLHSSRLKKGPLSAPALDFDFILSQDKNTARLAPAHLTYPSGKVGVGFSHEPAQQQTAITFTGEEIDIADAREVCLPLLAGVSVSDTLFDILRGGTAKTITVGFTGKSLDTLFDGSHLVLSGEAEAARVKIPETPLIARDVNAKVTMHDGILHIEPSRGKVAAAQIKGGVLDIDLLRDEEVPFSGTFTLGADLGLLPEALISLLPGTDLADELSRMSKVSGRADAILGLKMAPGQADLAVSVTAKNIQAQGVYDRIPLPLSIEQGEFRLKGDVVTLKQIQGFLGESPVRNLSAQVTLGETPDLKISSAEATLAIETLMPWLNTYPGVMALFQPARSLSGTLTLDRLSLSGPMFTPGLWQFDATGSGQDIVIGFDGHPRAIEDVSGKFTMTQDQIAASHLQARVMDLMWLDFALDEKMLASIRLPLEVFDSRMDEKAEDIFIHGKLTSPAGILVAFDLDGKDLDLLAPTLIQIKDPELTDVMILPYQDPEKPLLSFEGRLNTRSLEKLLFPDSFLHKTLKSATADHPVTVFTDNQSRVHLEADKLDLDILFPNHGKKPPRAPGPKEKSRPLLAQKSLFFRAEELIYNGIDFTEVDSHISFNPSATEVNIGHIKLCDLAGNGQVDIIHGNQTPMVTTRFNVQALNQKNIADVISCLFSAESIIDGSYSAAIDVSGKDTSEKIARQQDGKLTFYAEKGRIYKATLLSRVLSVINVLGDTDLRQEGFAYNTITVEAEIKESVAHLTRAYIDAENMAIIASGWVDPLNDRLDITFLVAPLKTIDTIIQNIPLVNTLLSGRLVSFPARASGKISDPDVTPLAPSAVGKGLVTLLGDLVKAPVRIMKGEGNQ